MKKLKWSAALFLFCLPPLFAQDAAPANSNDANAAMEQRIKDLEERIIALEGQVRTMKSQAAPPAAPAATPEAAAQPAAQPLLLPCRPRSRRCRRNWSKRKLPPATAVPVARQRRP